MPVKHIHQDLIEGCRNRSQKAQMQIYKLYYKAMFNTSLRIVNDTAEAEDVMQESFLQAFQSIDTFRGDASFGSWLKRIVVNRSLDALRKNQTGYSLDELDHEPAEPGMEEEDYMMVLSSRVESIRKGIHLLPDNYRVVLSLYLLEGYDHEEIAQVLGIKENLSRIRYFRARKKLLEHLGSEAAANSAV
jgi:RNA polymerase sigma-70 factor (ECF subfamily)